MQLGFVASKENVQNALSTYLEPSANDKVQAWLHDGSPQAIWPGADAASMSFTADDCSSHQQ